MQTIIFENKEYNIKPYYRTRTEVPPFLIHATSLKQMRLRPTGKPVTTVRMCSYPYEYDMYDIRETEPVGRLTWAERELAIGQYIAYETWYKAPGRLKNYLYNVYALKNKMYLNYKEFIRSKEKELKHFLFYLQAKADLKDFIHLYGF